MENAECRTKNEEEGRFSILHSAFCVRHSCPSLHKCDLVNFSQRRSSFRYLLQRRLSQYGHSFFFRRFFDFRSGTAVEDHAANTIGEIEKFRDRRTAVESGAVALQAAFSFPEGLVSIKLRIQTRL